MEDTSCNERQNNEGKKNDKLNEQKIVAKVNEPTDWISSMVVVKKLHTGCMFLSCHVRISELPKCQGISCSKQKRDIGNVKIGQESSYLTTFLSPCEKLRWLRISFGINAEPK